MSITKRVNKDGTTRYVVREYTGFTLDGRRDRQSVTCSTLREARRVQAELVARRDAMRGRSGRITLRAYVEGWWWPQADRLAKSTRDTYRRELDLRILPLLGDVDVRDVTRVRVQQLVDACGTLAVARKTLGVLHAILAQAVGDDLIASNPAGARYRMPPEGRKRDNGLVITSFGAMEPLLAAVDEYGSECVSKLAYTGLLAGLRPEERYGLNHEDVDLAARRIHVRRAYTATGSSPRMRGALVRDFAGEKLVRIIPAHAGSTQSPPSLWSPLRDHPRACGEHPMPSRIFSLEKGSSPRMRGAPQRGHGGHAGRRIIPAHAGSTTTVT